MDRSSGLALPAVAEPSRQLGETREPAGLPIEAASLVEAYQRASKADATVRAYRGDAEVFQAWCARYGFRSLPASPEAVAAFLVAEAEAGRAASTIGRRLAAIRYAHKLAHQPDPTEDEGGVRHPEGHPAQDRHRAGPERPPGATATLPTPRRWIT